MSKRKRDRRQQEEVTDPSELDIFLGRHKYCFHHVGNKAFRTLIANNTEWYASESTKSDKMAVVAFLLYVIQSGKGRFLKEGPFFNQWHEVDNKIAREKISHALRDQMNQRMCRNKKESSSDQSESEDSTVSDSRAHIEEKQGSQPRNFMAPLQPPFCWGSLVHATLNESKKPSKSGAMKDYSTCNPRKDKSKPGSNGVKCEQALERSTFAEKHLSVSSPAQLISMTTPVGGESSAFFSIGTTMHQSNARVMESELDQRFVQPNDYAGLDYGFRRQTPDLFYNSVVDTLQKTIRVSQAVNSALASPSDLNRGTQFDAATDTDLHFQRKHAPNTSNFAQERNYRNIRDPWIAQHLSMVTNNEETRDIFSTSEANSLLGVIQKSSSVSEAEEATFACSSGPKRGTRMVEAAQPETKFEVKRAPNSNVVEQKRQDSILSNAWVAQHASIVSPTGGTGDIFPPSATTNSRDSLKPRLMATTLWSPYSHTGMRSTTSLRRNSLGDAPLDHSHHQEPHSFETTKLCEDIENPLPLSDDNLVSVDIAEYLGSFARDANAYSGADDDHHNFEDEDAVGTNDHEIALHEAGTNDHEIRSHEASGRDQLAMPGFARSTDQQLDAMLFDLFRR